MMMMMMMMMSMTMVSILSPAPRRSLEFKSNNFYFHNTSFMKRFFTKQVAPKIVECNAVFEIA